MFADAFSRATATSLLAARYAVDSPSAGDWAESWPVSPAADKDPAGGEHSTAEGVRRSEEEESKMRAQT